MFIIINTTFYYQHYIFRSTDLRSVKPITVSAQWSTEAPGPWLDLLCLLYTSENLYDNDYLVCLSSFVEMNGESYYWASNASNRRVS